MSKKIIAVLGLILISGIIAWSVCEINKRRFDLYQEQLNSIIDRVISLNVSAANMIATKSSLSITELESIQHASNEFQQDLDNLGTPPSVLREAASALENGLEFYQQAYALLLAQSSTESGLQLDQEFFNLAMHGGEQIHHAVQLSASKDTSDIGIGTQSLLIFCKCW